MEVVRKGKDNNNGLSFESEGGSVTDCSACDCSTCNSATYNCGQDSGGGKDKDCNFDLAVLYNWIT